MVALRCGTLSPPREQGSTWWSCAGARLALCQGAARPNSAWKQGNKHSTREQGELVAAMTQRHVELSAREQHVRTLPGNRGSTWRQ